jgi:TRAP transporter 4TM/12TM fusion protein
VRRTVGNMLTVVVVVFLVFALIGHLVPGMLAGRQVAPAELVLYLGWDPTAVLGIPMRIVTTIVIAFVFFGQVLFKSGGSAFFTDISMVLMGRYRGGPAKISIFASSLFGSISGSVVSNVVTTGVITIPLMRRGGYRAHHAGAIEAVASTGGQLMPPIMGAAAFLMAEFLQIGYTEVVLAAIIPSVLYYVALFIQADLEAAKSGIKRVPAEQIPRAWPVIKSGWFFPLPFVVLIVALFNLNYSPEESALWAAATVIVFGVGIGYKGKRLTPRDVFEAIKETGTTVLDIVMIGGAAGIVIGVLNISGLGFGLTLFLVHIAGGSLIALLVVGAGVCILLGMGMPTVGVYVLLATLVAPALIEVGIDSIAAHMFIMYFGMMSMITPPVCIGAFAAATLTGADPMKTGFAAMRFGWLAFVIPFMFVGSTTLLMRGDSLTIILDLATALVGAWLVSVTMIGYFVRPLSILARLVLAAAGLVLLVPVDLFQFAGVANSIGIVFAAGFVLIELMARRSSQPA